jgi:rhodanese-related sulfurtransferase
MGKYIISIVTALFLFFNLNAQEKTINRVVGQSEFKVLLKVKDVQLIDVRTIDEFKGGHIGDAKNIDFNSPDFKVQLNKLAKNKPVLVYCHSGGRSGKTASLLNELGFKEVYDFQSGYSKWGK